jgi:sigma-B regulation protein RsbU (phosphoserine phosphatase)
MEVVDWEIEGNEQEPIRWSFGEDQVGSVTKTLEPVHTESPLSWVADQFESQPDLAALPIEKDGGVVGLVTRQRIHDRSTKFLESFSSRPLDQDLTPHGQLDARESIAKVVSRLFSDDKTPLVELFIVYLNGAYFGVTDIRSLVSRSARLRDQDLGKAKEVQESALSRTELPATSWQRSKMVRMAYGVGGDFYQEIGWSDGTCFLSCFDVSGKGISGSLVTSALGGFFAALRSEAVPAPAIERFAERLNEFLRQILPLGTFVTAVLFALPARPAASATMQILNLGYSNVYWYSRSENSVVGKGLKPNLPPLGLDDLKVAPESVFPLPFQAGTKVYVFSDGMGDLVNPSGRRYGDASLKTFLSKSYKYDAAGFLKQLEAEIEAFQGDAAQADDITALTIQA